VFEKSFWVAQATRLCRPATYLFSVVELVALRRVAPRPAAQRFRKPTVQAVPPLHAAGLSQRDNRYR